MISLRFIAPALALVLFAAAPGFADQHMEHPDAASAAEMHGGHQGAPMYMKPAGFAGPSFAYPDVFILCDDYEMMRKWYAETFGLSVFMDYGAQHGVSIYCSEGDTTVCFGDAKKMQLELPADRTSAFVLQFVVYEPQAAYDWAVAHGATGWMPPMDVGPATVSAIGDPEGNQIWLVTPKGMDGMEMSGGHNCMCGDGCASMCGGNCTCPEMEDDGEDDG
ncbi:MAG: hypothetical protein HRF49_00020 [bacterium]|jgi:predicted enzyme related to lactoylglutathione lyase